MFLQTAAILRRMAVRPRPQFTFDRRAAGLLMHPTSLAGPHGSGDVGAPSRAFVDFLHAAGQTWWQMLPVGPPGKPPGNSPYSSYSSFAGSAMLVDLFELADEGLLDRDDLAPDKSFRDDAVNYPAVIRYRQRRLRTAYAAFERLRDERHAAFGEFCARHASWLDDFALFSALKVHFKGAEWFTWDRDLRLRKPAALDKARHELADAVRFQKFVQFAFDRQWAALRAYANERGVGLIGDIPIFVAHDSADVWARRELWALDKNGAPSFVSGYPPDAFNADGQTWNHPQYDWRAHERDGYGWWVARFAQTFRLFDAARIDHFLGFERLWYVPTSAPTAKSGKWVRGPGAPLFDALRRELGDMPIIAEDLGLLTPKAAQLRDRFKFPGMRIMQFGFGGGGANYHLPHRYVRRCVAYTGTHDNETIVGWYDRVHTAARKRGNKTAAAELARVREYLNIDGQSPHEAFLRAALMSPADTVIFPVQDVLGLDGRHRMNTPGTADGNWKWRLPKGKLMPAVARWLRDLTETFERRPAAATLP
jgi:4-alpha-glucanotransferase